METIIVILLIYGLTTTGYIIALKKWNKLFLEEMIHRNNLIKQMDTNIINSYKKALGYIEGQNTKNGIWTSAWQYQKPNIERILND